MFFLLSQLQRASKSRALIQFALQRVLKLRQTRKQEIQQKEDPSIPKLPPEARIKLSINQFVDKKVKS